MDKLFRNYAISIKSSLDRLDDYGTVQITLNGKTYPKYREAKSLFTRLCERYPQTKFICHYDYYHHASKFDYYTEKVQRQMVKELSELLSIPHHNFVGVVLHSDTVFRKGLIVGKSISEKVLQKYNPLFYDRSRISSAAQDYIETGTLPYIQSFKSLSEALPSAMSGSHSHIFVETCVNSTWIDNESIAWVEYFARREGFSICWDTEHLYALNGYSVNSIFRGLAPCDMVHLNCIPEGVTPKSRKDLHSSTTIAECLVYHPYQYVSWAKELNDRGIPWVREVSAETIIREQSQL